ncbi:MAG TPA: hypothetical protein VKU44_07425 [Terriglobia bacterium]|nr:hypothetical protein [Terriglobia bacterium]
MVQRALVLILTLAAGAIAAAAQTIPSGTTLHFRLIQTLSARVNYPGDTFTALVSEPLTLSGQTLIPAGATLTGRVASVKRPGRISGVGEMRLLAQSLALPDGRNLPLDAVLEGTDGASHSQVGPEDTLKGPHSRVKTIGETTGFAAGGALVGLLFAHPLVGMAVGGTTGFVEHMHRRGDDLTLIKGSQIDYQLTRDLVLR